ncbi:uncharacterized protein LOC108682209 [Hyalella azteca]|uniref:Uncharacterized protein LOC108682209 n=1 Tax=Hyalella azteca TaxID=294128 RepID=A0A8B7PNA2_HYAAZ|nr:uncharacterized protein LOC108682209 [Hyalella azteca]XP_018026828.1 uncharacterized protein LOC108682209 [Hyalella azteca]
MIFKSKENSIEIISKLVSISCILLCLMCPCTCLPPEHNHPNGIILIPELEGKSHILPPPVEDVHNSLLSGGREVDPFPPSNHAPPATSEKSTQNKLKPEHESEHLQVLNENNILTGEVEKPASIYESIGNKSSVVPRKGVDNPKSIVGRKGVGDIESTTILEAEMADVIYSTSTSAEPELSSNTSYVTTTPRTTTQFVDRQPYNDIQKPPLELSTTTEKKQLYPELKPIAVKSSTASYKSTILVPVVNSSQTVVSSKHLKPDAAVDNITNNSVSSSLVLGVMFGVVFIIIIAILGYKKLQDIWTKRHYDRMDYLVDGMYDL